MTTYDVSRRDFLWMLGSSALLPVLGQGLPNSPAVDGIPNVILIVSDDVAFGELGVLDPVLKTPNLDRLARSGVRFSNAFVNTSLCAPGRACMLTGCYSRQNGVLDNDQIAKRSDSLMPYLKKAGYVTGMSGKWHWPMIPDPSEFGFDWQGAMVPEASLFAHPMFAYFGRDKKPIKVTKEEGDTAITDAAISFIQSKKSKPFFLWLAYFSAHFPMLMPKKYLEMYDPKDIVLPPNYVPPEGGGKPLTTRTKGTTYGGLAPNPEELRKGIALYHGMVSYMDDQIGRVLDALQKQGLSQKTLIIFISDNGFMLGNHGFTGKAFMYEESIKVPLIFSWPGKIKPAVNDELVCMMDLIPTVMDLAGVPAPSGVPGKSLLPLLNGKNVRLRDEVFCEFYPTKWKAVRNREWKYISTPESGDELYHVAEDPYEMKNLAGEAKHRAVLEKLKENWARFEKETGEPSPGHEDQSNYRELMKRERGRLVRLIEENDYDPGLAVDIGQRALVAWLNLLQAEGKRSARIDSFVQELIQTTYPQQMHSKPVRETMSEFLKEIVKCESRS